MFHDWTTTYSWPADLLFLNRRALPKVFQWWSQFSTISWYLCTFGPIEHEWMSPFAVFNLCMFVLVVWDALDSKSISMVVWIELLDSKSILMNRAAYQMVSIFAARQHRLFSFSWTRTLVVTWGIWIWFLDPFLGSVSWNRFAKPFLETVSYYWYESDHSNSNWRCSFLWARRHFLCTLRAGGSTLFSFLEFVFRIRF